MFKIFKIIKKDKEIIMDNIYIYYFFSKLKIKFKN